MPLKNKKSRKAKKQHCLSIASDDSDCNRKKAIN